MKAKKSVAAKTSAVNPEILPSKGVFGSMSRVEFNMGAFRGRLEIKNHKHNIKNLK
jgi:hypothetical protein